MATAPKTFSLIIPAFNEEALLGQTLTAARRACAAAALPCAEIVLVDNASTDQTAAIAREHGCRVVFEPFNQIARSRNTGGHASQGDYLVFLDADTRIDVELLQTALEALEGGTCAGGGALVGSRDAMPLLARVFTGLWNVFAPRLGWAAGNFLFCTREAWEGTGGFPEEFYASEEIHFCRRLKRWGRERNLKLRIIPQYTDTSMRKLHWYSGAQLFTRAASLLACPWRLRSREGCRLWYERPDRGRQRSATLSKPGSDGSRRTCERAKRRRTPPSVRNTPSAGDPAPPEIRR
jgi:glycosyltransferase involved in cell wall biosynthesis